MRRHLLGVLMGALIISTSLAAAQDVSPRIPPATAPEGGTGMGGVESPAHPQSEAQIVATLAASDRGEITHGRYAVAHARNFEVREYGRSLVTMHTSSSNRMNALARRLNITAAQGAESRRLTAGAAATQQRLARLSGDAFDRAFMDAQIAAHSQLLELLDHTLIPSAHTGDLRTALQTDVRPTVAAHLARARALRERL